MENFFQQFEEIKKEYHRLNSCEIEDLLSLEALKNRASFPIIYPIYIIHLCYSGITKAEFWDNAIIANGHPIFRNCQDKKENKSKDPFLKFGEKSILLSKCR